MQVSRLRFSSVFYSSLSKSIAIYTKLESIRRFISSGIFLLLPPLPSILLIQSFCFAYELSYLGLSPSNQSFNFIFLEEEKLNQIKSFLVFKIPSLLLFISYFRMELFLPLFLQKEVIFKLPLRILLIVNFSNQMPLVYYVSLQIRRLPSFLFNRFSKLEVEEEHKVQ